MPEFVTQLIAGIFVVGIIAFVAAIGGTIFVTAIISIFQVFQALFRFVAAPFVREGGGRHAAEPAAHPHKDKVDTSKFDTSGWEPDEVNARTGEVKTWVYKGTP